METFFEKYAEEYLNEDSKYINHIRKFVKYLKISGKSDRPHDVTSFDIENCVAYYVDKGNINCKTSLANHLEAIKALYSQLVKKHYLTENFRTIIPITDYESFKNKLSQKHNLKDKVTREWLQDDDIELLLELLDNYCDNKKNINKDNYIKRNCLRLFLKISLIAPAEKKVIINICYSNFTKDFRYLNIHGIEINVPNGLRYNILHAIELIDNKYDNNERFFYSFANIGNGGNSLCCWLATFLKQENLLDIDNNAKSYPVDVFSNTTIKNMVHNNVNPLYIAMITGNKIENLSKYYNLQEDTICQVEINNGILKCPYYSYL